MLPISQLEALPKISGIYRVLDAEGCVIYIGQARNIHERWNNGHHKLGKIIAEHGVDACIDWVFIPGWLLNRLVLNSPFTTFKSLSEQASKPKYDNASLPF